MQYPAPLEAFHVLFQSGRTVPVQEPDIIFEFQFANVYKSWVVYQMGPDLQGSLETIGRLRGYSSTVPLAVAAPQASNGSSTLIRVIEAGADEYISDSDSPINIVAKLVSLLRRAKLSSTRENTQVLTSGALALNPGTQTVRLGRETLKLTSTEFRLLHLLMNNRATVLTHRTINVALWGDRVDASEGIKKYIQRLRRKLRDDADNPRWIANVHGVGYRFLGNFDEAGDQGTTP